MRTLLILTTGLLLLTLTACGPGTDTLSEQNDELRRDNLELRREVEELNRRIEGRLAQLRALENQAGQPGTSAADRPTLTSIAFARFSGLSDEDGDGAFDTARVYIKTFDQRKRFLPVAGSARLKVVNLPPDGEPTVLAEQAYDAEAWEQAFRSGFAGTHYTLEAPLTSPIDRQDTVTIQVTVTDAATGATFTKQLGE